MSDDRMAAALTRRLAERDAADDDEWRKEKAPSREERDAEKRAETVERRTAVVDAMADARRKTAAHEDGELQAPPLADPNATLRDEIRRALEWHKSPPDARRAMARFTDDVGVAKRVAKTYGLEVKTPADVAAVLKAHGQGQGAAGAASPADAEMEALAPFRERAEAQGSSLPAVLQRYTAAEDFLTRDPRGALRWLCANHNVAPAELDPGLAPYAQTAQAAGMSLPHMVERYLAAEMLLEQDPAAALSFLCRHYGIDPRNLP